MTSVSQGPTALQMFRILSGLFTTGATFRIVLIKEGATVDYKTPSTLVAANEVVASGYTAGGKPITRISPAARTGLSKLAYQTVQPSISWDAEIRADGAFITNSTSVSVSSVFLVLDFGRTRESVDGVFTVRFPSDDPIAGLFRLES